MTKREKQAKFIFFEAQLILFAIKRGTPLVRLEWARSEAQQAIYVQKGLSKTMKSDHLELCASDFCFLEDIRDDGVINYPPDKYKELGEFWESLDPNCEWGGRFGDDPTTQKIEGWDSGHFGYKGDIK